MSQSWPLVPLGEVLNKSEEWVDLKPERVYREVTVRLWGRASGCAGKRPERKSLLRAACLCEHNSLSSPASTLETALSALYPNLLTARLLVAISRCSLRTRHGFCRNIFRG